MKRYFKSILGASALGYETYRIHTNISSKKHIVFDLDETLILSEDIDYISNINNRKYRTPFMQLKFEDIKEDVKEDNEEYYVYKRPYATFCLSGLSSLATLHIFTSSNKEYCHPILEKGFGNMYFDSITCYEDYNSDNGKDISVISADAILVDDKLYNNVYSQKFYHIPPYKGDILDIELLKFMIYFIWNEIF